MRALVVAIVVAVSSPTSARPPDAKDAVVLVIDRSLPEDKLALAIDTFVDAVGKLDPEQQVAVIGAGKTVTVELPLTPASDKTLIETRVRAVKRASKGDLLAAMRRAGALLAKAKATWRHVLVVTDGDELLTVGPTATKLRNSGITVSSLGYQSLNRITLGDIASYGGGTLHLANDRKALVKAYLDDLVPVDRRELAVVFVIDRSGSMHGPRLEAAKEVARVATEILKPTDLVSVVTFDDKAQIYVQPMRAANRMRVSTDIARITTGSSASNVYPALQESLAILEDTSSQLKHVIVISDGEMPTDGVAEIVQDMRAADIMVSAIAVQGADVSFLGMIAERGDGRLFRIESSGALPTLFGPQH